MDGSVEHYKACLITKGFSQCPRFNYFKTFASIAKFAAICAILTLSTLEDFHLGFVDISYVFINRDLDTVVYMEQPKGFEQGKPKMVYCLIKGLYGLKQVSCLWHKKLKAALE